MAGVTIGNVLVKPLAEKKSKILKVEQMRNKDDFFKGEVIDVGGEDGLYPLDGAIVPGAIVLVPKVQKQKFPIDGEDHYICHYSEIKYVYANG
jgi:hypothetical protein